MAGRYWFAHYIQWGSAPGTVWGESFQLINQHNPSIANEVSGRSSGYSLIKFTPFQFDATI